MKACKACQTRAKDVEQFEQALAQNVSEALQTIQQFTSEHAASAQQYAVKIKRTKANGFLASESGRELRAMINQVVCAWAAPVSTF